MASITNNQTNMVDKTDADLSKLLNALVPYCRMMIDKADNESKQTRIEPTRGFVYLNQHTSSSPNIDVKSNKRPHT